MHKSGSSSLLGPGGLDLAQAFFTPIQFAAPPSPTKRHTKISIIGTGNVGMAIAQTILTQVPPTISFQHQRLLRLSPLINQF